MRSLASGRAICRRLKICVLSGNSPRYIAIDSIFVSADQCSMPQGLASSLRVADEAELDDIYETERRLLYFACTRAREHLLLTGVAPVSEYLADLQTPEAPGYCAWGCFRCFVPAPHCERGRPPVSHPLQRRLKVLDEIVYMLEPG